VPIQEEDKNHLYKDKSLEKLLDRIEKTKFNEECKKMPKKPEKEHITNEL
jgi:hypothetical protein